VNGNYIAQIAACDANRSIALRRRNTLEVTLVTAPPIVAHLEIALSVATSENAGFLGKPKRVILFPCASAQGILGNTP
jgi:hypothetical protein